MGILDDAIREHLDLKRRLGGDQEEIARLEDEAFGPPTRPGDPEFPERPAGDADGSTSEFAAAADAPVAPGPEEPSAGAGLFDATAEEAPAADAPPATAEAAIAPEADAAPPAAPEAPAAEPEPAQAPAPVSEPEAPAADAASDLELDLDLDLEEAAGEVVEPESGEEDLLAESPATDEQPLEGEVQAEPPPEAPIESLPTVEHHFEGAIDDAEVVEEEKPAPATEAPPSESAPQEGAPETSEGSEEDEDVLEETPEFLRDNPDDDELWFEQGEPKDFDF